VSVRSLLDLAQLDPAEAVGAHGPAQHPWRCARTGIWVVENHALVSDALSRPAEFSSKVSLAALDAEFPAAEVEAIYRAGGYPPARTLQTNDPPAHRRFRVLVERVFTPSRVEATVPHMEAACASLLEQWPADVPFEAMAGFAVPLPLRVISTQLGVPAEDFLLFKRWSDAAIQAIGLGATREQQLAAARCGVEFQHYFAALLADPARRPEGSLIDRVAQAAQQPDSLLTVPEQLSLLHTLMIAGHETTTSTLGSLLHMLAEQPALAASARHDAKLQKRLIEEALRLQAPVQGLFRITTQAMKFGEVELPARSLLCLRLGAANRDPARFASGGELDLAGPIAAHLSFGAGIHHCIGAPLARRELGIALAALLARFTRFELAPGAGPLQYSASVMTRALLALPLIAQGHP
jgi:cytochrome P450